MAQFNTLNVKLSNSHINRLKAGIKNGTEVILKVSSNVFGIEMMKIVFSRSCC